MSNPNNQPTTFTNISFAFLSQFGHRVKEQSKKLKKGEWVRKSHDGRNCMKCGKSGKIVSCEKSRHYLVCEKCASSVTHCVGCLASRLGAFFQLSYHQMVEIIIDGLAGKGWDENFYVIFPDKDICELKERESKNFTIVCLVMLAEILDEHLKIKSFKIEEDNQDPDPKRKREESLQDEI